MTPTVSPNKSLSKKPTVPTRTGAGPRSKPAGSSPSPNTSMSELNDLRRRAGILMDTVIAMPPPDRIPPQLDPAALSQDRPESFEREKAAATLRPGTGEVIPTADQHQAWGNPGVTSTAPGVGTTPSIPYTWGGMQQQEPAAPRPTPAKWGEQMQTEGHFAPAAPSWLGGGDAPMGIIHRGGNRNMLRRRRERQAPAHTALAIQGIPGPYTEAGNNLWRAADGNMYEVDPTTGRVNTRSTAFEDISTMASRRVAEAGGNKKNPFRKAEGKPGNNKKSGNKESPLPVNEVEGFMANPGDEQESDFGGQESSPAPGDEDFSQGTPEDVGPPSDDAGGEETPDQYDSIRITPAALAAVLTTVVHRQADEQLMRAIVEALSETCHKTGGEIDVDDLQAVAAHVNGEEFQEAGEKESEGEFGPESGSEGSEAGDEFGSDEFGGEESSGEPSDEEDTGEDEPAMESVELTATDLGIFEPRHASDDDELRDLKKRIGQKYWGAV